MTDAIFNLCVVLLVWLGRQLGMTYEAVNVWLFCVLWPLLTLGLICCTVCQHRHICRLQSHRKLP